MTVKFEGITYCIKDYNLIQKTYHVETEIYEYGRWEP